MSIQPIPPLDLSKTDNPNPQPTPEKITVGEMGNLLKNHKEQFLSNTALALYRNGKTEQKQKRTETDYEKSA